MDGQVDLPIHGNCSAEFSAVRDAFGENFRRRGEIGAAVCIYKDGKPAVDLWGGHKDTGRTMPWTENTIVILNSLAKSMCALCMHILIDRGIVDFDAPVADFWPEFAHAGKQGVLIRHILSHTDGVIYSDQATPGSWFRWEEHVKALEAQEPAWTPGTFGAYNSVNYGYLVGEVIRRVTGKTIGAFLRSEVSEKLEADYNIGLRPDEISRVSDMHENPNNPFFKIAANPTTPLGRAQKSRPDIGHFQNIREIRELEMPSFGGHGNARSMARIFAMLAMDGRLDGVSILSPGGVERTRWLAWERDCIMTKRFLRMGFGFMHNYPDVMPMGENMGAYGHTGVGGAFAWCDRDRNMSFAYCTNLQREGPGIGSRGAAVSVAAGGGKAPSWLT